MNLKERLLLVLIIIVGLYFRLNGINFDKTCCQHPDERAIVMFTLPLSIPTSTEEFLSPASRANPHFFAYGNLPLYLLKSSSVAASIIDPKFLTYSYINLVGRTISVFVDIATIILIFLLGRTISSNKVGLAGAFIYSVAVLPIQYSHFYTSDILLTFFILLTIWRSVRFYKKPTLRNAVLVGIAFGLALATKISAIPVINAISLAILLDFIFVFKKSPRQPKKWLPYVPPVLRRLATQGIIVALSTIITFLIVQPYALIDSSEFIKQNIQQSKMTTDAYTFPYTLQYVGKTPFFYELKNLFLAGLGPIIFTLSAFGIYLSLAGLKNLNQAKKSEYIIILSFTLVYFLIVGRFAIGFMRYLLPIYPLLSLFAGVALIFVIERIELIKQNALKFLLIAITLTLILIWPVSFSSIYTRVNTRLGATEWINANIPSGKVLTHEVWDDQLPMQTTNTYQFIDLPMYDQPDDINKWSKINSNLQKADYLIISSNRLSTPIQKLADCTRYKVCFPIASAFYNDLFNGKLQFKKVAEFSSYPTIPILNVEINDQNLDESFTVYDHPKVQIYKKITTSP